MKFFSNEEEKELFHTIEALPNIYTTTKNSDFVDHKFFLTHKEKIKKNIVKPKPFKTATNFNKEKYTSHPRFIEENNFDYGESCNKFKKDAKVKVDTDIKLLMFNKPYCKTEDVTTAIRDEFKSEMRRRCNFKITKKNEISQQKHKKSFIGIQNSPKNVFEITNKDSIYYEVDQNPQIFKRKINTKIKNKNLKIVVSCGAAAEAPKKIEPIKFFGLPAKSKEIYKKKVISQSKINNPERETKLFYDKLSKILVLNKSGFHKQILNKTNETN